MLRTRIAPTPSGYLHIGNALSFAITWLLARQNNGFIYLRIDDIDTARYRPEYVDDIFDSLAWLGLNWEGGPKTRAEFESGFSQKLRHSEYESALIELQDKGLVYGCTCSREDVRSNALELGKSPHLYAGTCRYLKLPPYRMGGEALTQVPAYRYRLVEGQNISWINHLGELIHSDPSQEMGDFVIWTKLNTPAYQLVSVVDDLREQINYWVRGADLLASTAAQLALAQCLAPDSFGALKVLHHGLIEVGDQKLSKSKGSTSLKSLRERGVSSAEIWRYIGRQLGLQTNFGEFVQGPQDLLGEFNLNALPIRSLNWEKDTL